MNQRIKKLWIDALRSDGYAQGSGRLRVGDAYCCLGVLCDLHARETGNQWEDGSTDLEDDMCVYLGSDCVLPGAVSAWAELDSTNGALHDGSSSLAYYNDMGNDFHFIADQIEKYL